MTNRNQWINSCLLFLWDRLSWNKVVTSRKIFSRDQASCCELGRGQPDNQPSFSASLITVPCPYLRLSPLWELGLKLCCTCEVLSLPELLSQIVHPMRQQPKGCSYIHTDWWPSCKWGSLPRICTHLLLGKVHNSDPIRYLPGGPGYPGNPIGPGEPGQPGDPGGPTAFFPGGPCSPLLPFTPGGPGVPLRPGLDDPWRKESF